MLGLVNSVKMRKSKLTAEEIEAAEKAADDRKRNRNNGYSLMEIRDRGWERIHDETGREVVFIWPIDKDKIEPWVPHVNVPEGKFLLEFTNIDGRKDRLVFDSDDFQRCLRWV